jgi:hypothetical protein
MRSRNRADSKECRVALRSKECEPIFRGEGAASRAVQQKNRLYRVPYEVARCWKAAARAVWLWR